MIRITQITTVHSRYDVRIFSKVCCSLAAINNYNLSLIVADGKGNEFINNVEIIDVGLRTSNKLIRMIVDSKRVFKKAKVLNSDIYHLHDPELIPIGIKLRSLGKIVIFDSHEDVSVDILTKEYIPHLFRIITSFCYVKYEEYALRKFSFLIAATPYIRDKLLKINFNCIDINNFPILSEIINDVKWGHRHNEVCYVGGLSRYRGIIEMVKAMGYTDKVKLNIAGQFSDNYILEEASSSNGWLKVNNCGFLNRNQLIDVMSISKAGIVVLHPLKNYIVAQPIKMYEYMLAGLPVICSDFPLWREIIEGNHCGICVNPLNPKEIASAIEYIISHPVEAEKMGINGKNAVINKFNWGFEEIKLLKVYDELSKKLS